MVALIRTRGGAKPNPGLILSGVGPGGRCGDTHEGRPPDPEAKGERAKGRQMDFRFSYDMTVRGLVVAYDIDGRAEIEVDADGDWTVGNVWLDSAAYGDKRSVVLPEGHPLCSDIKIWLLNQKRAAIDEAVGDLAPHSDPHAGLRHSVRELI